MTKMQSPIFRLEDYRPTPYALPRAELDIDLIPQKTLVKAKLHFARREGVKAGAPLILDGDSLTLKAIKLNGAPLAANAYRAAPERLELLAPPAAPFTLELTTEINPDANRALMGLYRSNGVFCTQCEADGFRRITYFYDRPDVLSVYTVRLAADKAACPVLLANGNLAAAGELAGGRHYAVWHDPFPKPCYLFACVGGRLDNIQDFFTTADGRRVELNIYTEPGKSARALYAMDSLKRAFKWDEEKFGRIYDLDIFNIVAVSDFNMGAMENKGLNIFNDKYVLADPQSATDADYADVERVIAHEYFHNWTGDRITCRDWFQLCLKEGLTVFRDQEFSSDQRSRPVQRLHDAAFLAAEQFAEDAGPLAHPVRPRQYSEINNFYTVTVYEKGAELVRMLTCLLGREGFAKGMELYFRRYDGQACAIEDFIGCFAESSGRDMSQFMLWYHQAGTPKVAAASHYNAAAGLLEVKLRQSLRPTDSAPRPLPMLIPLRFGLVGPDGRDLPFETRDKAVEGEVILLSKAEQTVQFKVKEQPVLSLLRGFSAPIMLEQNLTPAEKLFLARHDCDLTNRCRILHNLALNYLAAEGSGKGAAKAEAKKAELLDAYLAIAENEQLEPAYRAVCLSLPAEAEIAAAIGANIEPEAIARARQELFAALAAAGKNIFAALRQKHKVSGAFSPDAEAAGHRALRHIAIEYEAAAANSPALAAELYAKADNMTERLAGLRILLRHFGQTAAAKNASADFAAKAAADPLMMDKWFALQAAEAEGAEALNIVRALTQHKSFSFDNPNRVRALIGAFAAGNQIGFHRADGAAYVYYADILLELDRSNPQLAARLLKFWRAWRQLESGRQAKIAAQLKRIAAAPQLSRDSRDIAERLLAPAALSRLA